MERLLYFATGLLSTLGITNFLGGNVMPSWHEQVIGLVGGVCSTILVAWLRWQWEHRKPDRSG